MFVRIRDFFPFLQLDSDSVVFLVFLFFHVTCSFLFENGDVSEDVPVLKVSEDLPVLNISEDLSVLKVNEDLPVLNISEDLPVLKVSEDLPMLYQFNNSFVQK
jgi:hypothetical protein